MLWKKAKSSSYEIDMTSGPLLGKLLRFSIPLILSGMLQLLFNAADMVVVGRFEGGHALAAVGAAAPLTHLITNLFIGLSVGANVLAARYYGGKHWKALEETVHTAVTTSLLCGLALIAVGVGLAQPLLELMSTPADVLEEAVLYIRIYFCGMPVVMLYNFGSAILRAVGDTKRPLLFLTAAGAINVGLNVFFVAVLGMGVEGVAIATVVSQAVAAVLVVAVLARSKGMCRLERKCLKINKEKLGQMLRVGIPAGIQGAAFSVSNLLIQSSVNSLGTAVMAASAVAINIDSFCFVAIDALSQAALSFTGQCYGAGEFKRILCLFQFVNATLNIPFNVLRGMGRSVFPMVSTIVCVCGLRVPWIYLVFRNFPTVAVLYAAWPVTKGAASLTGIVYYFWLRKKIRRGRPIPSQP